MFALGLIFNVTLLAFFKYTNFLITIANDITGQSGPCFDIALPLAISFFTFQQIAYLMDCRRGIVTEHNFANYSLFVTFFPQLIAGPIVHHKEMMPQFRHLRNKIIHWDHISKGLYIFAIGLFKKIVLADGFSLWVANGFDKNVTLSLIPAWCVSLSYTFQIYFDFSGYTDMAIGSALLLNIRLPINFNSPYKALDIQDFWRRWHMTLSRFLRDYVYIPLGGNRGSDVRTLLNVFIVFLIGGIWHGAGWTFIVWGLFHGLMTVMHRGWTWIGLKMPKWTAWATTFLCVNMAWVFFRAKDLGSAVSLLKSMAGLNGVLIPEKFSALGSLLPSLTFGKPFEAVGNGEPIFWSLCLAFVIAFGVKNSMHFLSTFQPRKRDAIFIASVILIALVKMRQATEFLYFNF